MDENERLQAEAVEAVEKEIQAAEAIKVERMNWFEKIRKYWELFAFKSNVGNWAVKICLTLIVFISLHASMQYGLSYETSILSDVIKLLPEAIPRTQLTLLGFEAAISLVWMFMPAFGTLLSAILLYMSFAGLSPTVLMAAFIILLFFQMEDRPVTAMLIALPVLVFVSSANIGIFVAVLAAFVSIRKNNGTVRSLSILYWCLLELCNGCFGSILNINGEQIIPTVDTEVRVLEKLKTYILLVQEGGTTEHYFKLIWIFFLVFYAVGFIFAKVLNIKGSKKKISIEIADGIIFVVLYLLFIGAIIALKRFELVTQCRYSIFSIGLQLLIVYIVTRPIAGKSPMRGDAVVDQDKNYIFISYAHADLERVKPYLKMLSESGYEFWYDDSIKTGTEWQGVIASNLSRCTCFLAFISKTSIQSEYCLKEINYATSKNKPMAVIMLDDVMLPPVLEMHLASLQAVQRNKYNNDSECMSKVFEMEQLKTCKY